MGRKKKSNPEWISRIDYFSLEDRHYKDSFLEICEVYDDKVEVDLFSREDPNDWEIYIIFGYMTGLVKTSKDKEAKKREEIKKALIEEYKKNESPSDEFVKKFEKEFNFEWQEPFDDSVDPFAALYDFHI